MSTPPSVPRSGVWTFDPKSLTPQVSEQLTVAEFLAGLEGITAKLNAGEMPTDDNLDIIRRGALRFMATTFVESDAGDHAQVHEVLLVIKKANEASPFLGPERLTFLTKCLTVFEVRGAMRISLAPGELAEA